MIRLGIGLPLHGQIAFILDADILFDKDFTIIGGPPDDSTLSLIHISTGGLSPGCISFSA